MSVALLDQAESSTTHKDGEVGVAEGCRQGRALTQPLDVLTAAAAIGLVAGLLEGSYWWLKQHAFQELTCLHPGYWWMAPLGLATFLALPAAGLAIVSWRRPRWDALPIGLTIFALFGWLNLLLLVPWLHVYSSLLLACGLAAATGRLFQRHRERWLAVFRRTSAWLATLLVVAAICQSKFAMHAEQRAIAALPTPPTGAPNVLLIVLDAVRADSLELYGAGREVAPNVAALAAQGATFDRAWSTAPWTLPSQSGMFTGRLPSELSADWLAALDGAAPTLAEQLAQRGWLTGGFVGNTHYCSAETGLARGFAHYEDYRFTALDAALCTALGRRVLLSSLAVDCGLTDWPARKRADEVSGGLLRWLDQRGDRPYFAFVNYFDAHDPYVAPSGYRTVAPKTRDDVLLLRHWWSAPKDKLTPEQVRLMETSYEDCIRGLDAHLGQTLADLKRRGHLENTMIIVTADHGEHFGDHGLYLHGNSLYESLLHVPLVVVWPERIPAGVRVKTPVSLSGLPSSVLSLAGNEPTLPGTSWAPCWTADERGEVVAAEIPSQARYPPCHGHSPVAHGAMQALLDGDLKYIRGGNGAEELFDLARDPMEQHNVVNEPAYRSAAWRLRGIWQERYGQDSLPCKH